MKHATRISLSVAVALVLAGSSWVMATPDLAKQNDLKCTVCHDKAGSKLLTDRGIYFEAMGSLDGYDSLRDEFGKCTSCHVRKPGSQKLTKEGQKFADVVDTMAELQEWLNQRHPKPDNK